MEMDPMKRTSGVNMDEDVESGGKLLEAEKTTEEGEGEVRADREEVVVDEKKSTKKKKKKGPQGESEKKKKKGPQGESEKKKKKAKGSRKKRGSDPAASGDSGGTENQVMKKSASTPNSAESETRWTDGTSAGALEASEVQSDGGDGRRKKSSEGNGKGLEGGGGKGKDGKGKGKEEKGKEGKGGELATRDDEATNTGVVIVETGEEDGRETWTRGADFLLSIIGFAVDLANVWRFPYLCYRNGGGAFLIPYTLMLVFGALPLFYMELILGQFNRQGPISVWRICPLFKGVGFCAVLVAFYVSFYYNVIIGWALYFLVASASAAPSSADLPWLHCNNSWNTDDCWEGVAAVTSVPPSAAPSVLTSSPHPSSSVHGGHHGHGHHSAAGAAVHASVASAAHVHAAAVQVAAETQPNHHHTPQAPVARPANSPASEYFHRAVLEMQGSGGLHDLGVPKWQLVLCVFLVYTMLYLSLFKGVKSSGKVVWATATLPYVVLSILLVRGLMLPGALSGISYYLNPELQRLGDTQVWVDAAVQIFYSVGAGFGVHLSYASYNTFHNNCLRDCLVTTAVNCFTSFFSGLVIFTYLGFMSHKQGVPISSVAAEGPGLVFQVYPEAVATLPGSHIWSMLFFFMLIMLGLDSAMGGMECVITGLMDEFKGVFKGRRFAREIFTLLAILVSFSVALMNVTPGGMYMFHLLDTYSAGISLLCSALFEALAVSWFYGLERFSADVEAMLGSKPGLYWRICWKFISPSFIIGVVLFGLIYHQPLKYNDYSYPAWAELLGWSLALSSVLMIPIVAIIRISRTPGSCRERIAYNITPIEEHDKIRREGMDGVSRFKCKHWLYV